MDERKRARRWRGRMGTRQWRVKEGKRERDTDRMASEMRIKGNDPNFFQRTGSHTCVNQYGIVEFNVPLDTV